MHGLLTGPRRRDRDRPQPVLRPVPRRSRRPLGEMGAGTVRRGRHGLRQGLENTAEHLGVPLAKSCYRVLTRAQTQLGAGGEVAVQSRTPHHFRCVLVELVVRGRVDQPRVTVVVHHDCGPASRHPSCRVPRRRFVCTTGLARGACRGRRKRTGFSRPPTADAPDDPIPLRPIDVDSRGGPRRRRRRCRAAACRAPSPSA
jgi:hypothetical protein